MSDHKKRSFSRFFDSARIRAVLSLGIVLGFGSVSTLAFWSDTATMTTGSITSGSLDLQLQGNLSGQGGTWNNASFNFANMIPGESFALAVPVQRAAGSAPFSYTASATASGGLVTHLRWSTHQGSANTQSVSANGLRTQACSGTVINSGITLATTAVNVIPARNLTGTTMNENICIRVELLATAPNTAQSQSATASFVFNATQFSS